MATPYGGLRTIPQDGGGVDETVRSNGAPDRGVDQPRPRPRNGHEGYKEHTYVPGHADAR